MILGSSRTLFGNGAFQWGYDVSPDGRRIVLGVTPGGEKETSLVIVQNWFAEVEGR